MKNTIVYIRVSTDQQGRSGLGADAQRRAIAEFCAEEVWRWADLLTGALERLADADAFGSLGLSRREALRAIRGLAEGRAGRKPGSPMPSRAWASLCSTSFVRRLTDILEVNSMHAPHASYARGLVLSAAEAAIFLSTTRSTCARGSQ
jgi:hypothetical protein